MKKNIAWIIALVCTISLLARCEKQEISEPAPTKTTVLTEDELAYFNGDSFFNGGDSINIRNQFLSSSYDQPADIDLFELFYCGSGLDETITEEELATVMEKIGIAGSVDDIPCDCQKNSCSNMDKILTEYMGIRLADTNKIGLEQFVYLPQYDAYYSFHGDTNYRVSIQFSSGERKGDVIRLFYNDGFYADGQKVLTLKEKSGSYLFIANQKIKSEAATN